MSCLAPKRFRVPVETARAKVHTSPDVLTWVRERHQIGDKVKAPHSSRFGRREKLHPATGVAFEY